MAINDMMGSITYLRLCQMMVGVPNRKRYLPGKTNAAYVSELSGSLICKADGRQHTRADSCSLRSALRSGGSPGPYPL